jgi:hypothetical protein
MQERRKPEQAGNYHCWPPVPQRMAHGNSGCHDLVPVGLFECWRWVKKFRKKRKIVSYEKVYNLLVIVLDLNMIHHDD